MTTRPTDEEIRAMADMIDAKCFDSRFIGAAPLLRRILTERQAARDGVKDMHLQEVLNILDYALAHIGTSNFIGLALSKSDIECMRAALQSDEMVSVTKTDANKYCQILSLLGMEEEGDPVAWVKSTLAIIHERNAKQAARESIAQAVPDGWKLVPQRFIDLVKAAAHPEVHPRAIPQLIAKAIDALSAAPAHNGKREGMG